MNPPVEIAVIGAGLTGLSAALSLQAKGYSVDLFEKQDRCGGVITTVHHPDYLYELGPSTLQRGTPVLESVLKQCGLLDELVTPAPAARNRFVIRDGKTVAIPHSPLSFPFSRWLSLKGKLRLLQEPFIRKGEHSDQESIADFTRRRLGSEVLDYGVNPFISGIYAGDPEQLSLRLAFPKLYQAEQAGGSLIKGFRMLAKRKPRPRIPRGILTFRQGMQQLPEAMRAHFKGQFHPSITLNKIEKSGSGWQLSWTPGADRERQQKSYSSVIVSGWSPELRTLLTPYLPHPWPEIDYAGVQTVALAFDRTQVSHPLNGFGILAPSRENLPFLGVIFTSSLFPERAPKEQVLLNLFLGGKQHPEYVGLSPQELEAQVLPALSQILGIHGTPLFIDSRAWKQAIPQYTPAHEAFLHSRDLMEQNHPGLYLAGNVVDGISMPYCLESGHNTAEKVHLHHTARDH